MAIGKVEVMNECFSKHSRMATARMKWDKETEVRREEWVWKEVKRAREKRVIPTALTIDRAYTVPSGSLLPEAVDELPNEPNQHL